MIRVWAWRRRRCRKHGHVWWHRIAPTDMCNANHSTCVHCGFRTWRYWEDTHA